TTAKKESNPNGILSLARETANVHLLGSLQMGQLIIGTRTALQPLAMTIRMEFSLVLCLLQLPRSPRLRSLQLTNHDIDSALARFSRHPALHGCDGRRWSLVRAEANFD